MIPVEIVIPVTTVNPSLDITVSYLEKHTDIDRITITYHQSLEKYIGEQRKRITEKKNIEYHSFSDKKTFFQLATDIIASSRKDVLLLDPSIIVTSGWLVKLQQCAYSDNKIAFASPFCNNGSLCSLPVSNKNNKIPFDPDKIEKLSSLVELKSKKTYPSIPAAQGYCMYLKRDVIAQVGLFHQEPGFPGLRLDYVYSWKAQGMGLKTVLCDDTFVYCPDNAMIEAFKQTGSISKSLKNRFLPELTELSDFIEKKPLQALLDTIRVAWVTGNGKKNILFNLHYGYEAENKNNVGGTQFLVRDIVNGISNEFNCFVLFNDYQGMTLNLYVGHEKIVVKYKLLKRNRQIEYTNFQNAHLIHSILQQFEISLVHIHHVIDQTWDIAYEAHKLGIPIILSLHDYYWICPSLNLISHEDKYCISLQSPNYCEQCLYRKFGYKANILDIWREKADEVMDMCDIIITPSRSTKDIYIKYYQKYSNKFRVVPHGIESLQNHYRLSLKIKDKLNIAIVGYVSQTKGSDLAYQLIQDKRAGDIEWFFFGLIQDTRFLHLKKDNVHVFGTYKRDDLPRLIYENNIHIACILSTAPETFCYVLSEVQDIGVPVIASDIGALSERVKDSESGWLIPSNANPDDFYRIIEALKKTPEDYNAKINKLAHYHVRHVSDMVSEYLEMYEEKT